MNAKEARRICLARQAEIDEARLTIEGDLKALKARTIEDRVKDVVKDWQSDIKKAAEKGSTYIEIYPPHDDQNGEIFKAAKLDIERDKFRLRTYQTDEGYCIGYRTHYTIDW